MGARRRVRKFLKDYWPIGDAIGTGLYDGHLLLAADVGQLVQDSRKLKQVLADFRALEEENEKLHEQIVQLEHKAAGQLPELDTEPLEGVEELKDAVVLLEQLLVRADNSHETITISQQDAWQLLRRAKQQPGRNGITRAADGTEWEWITKAERTAKAERRDELVAELHDIEALIPSGYFGTTVQKIARWTDLQARKIEELKADADAMRAEMALTWQQIPLVYHPRNPELHVAVKTALYDLNQKLDRARDARSDLQIKLRVALEGVEPEIDGAQVLQKWVNIYTDANATDEIHQVRNPDGGDPVMLSASAIQATLRQLNEARVLIEQFKRRNDAAGVQLRRIGRALEGRE